MTIIPQLLFVIVPAVSWMDLKITLSATLDYDNAAKIAEIFSITYADKKNSGKYFMDKTKA